MNSVCIAGGIELTCEAQPEVRGISGSTTYVKSANNTRSSYLAVGAGPEYSVDREREPCLVSRHSIAVPVWSTACIRWCRVQCASASSIPVPPKLGTVVMGRQHQTLIS
jgi:hypothetical protein